MGDCAFLFPGQGAQTIGMAARLIEASPAARRIFERGGEILGFDIARICASGPAEILDSTRVSQPAIFLHSLAAVEAIAEKIHRRPRACAAAGLSLGEYSALVFAESIRFEDALRVVARRGQAMQEACEEVPGGMASIIGLPHDKVTEAVKEGTRAGVVGIANYNAPDQIVISGDAAALAAASAAATRLGARRVIPLRVAGAFHSPRMGSATRKLRPFLEGLEIREPRVPFVPNYTARVTRDPDEIRDGLLNQIESSVLWSPTVKRLIESGMRRAVEPGPGRVIAGLLRSIDRSVEVVSVGEPEGLAALPDGII